jgi:hypothetical protein
MLRPAKASGRGMPSFRAVLRVMAAEASTPPVAEAKPADGAWESMLHA